MAYRAYRLVILETAAERAREELAAARVALLETRTLVVGGTEAIERRFALAIRERDRIESELMGEQEKHREMARDGECACPTHQYRLNRASEIARFAYQWMNDADQLVSMDRAKHLFDEMEPGGNVG